jgi:Zn-dependent protease
MLVKKRGFYFSKKELHDLVKAWFILSLAFAIVFNGLTYGSEFFFAFIISAITVGTAFIFHELGHKFVAQHYGCYAEFRAFDNMLFLALLLSFFGFIFAAPGAVMISGPIGKRRNGKISAMGPGINLILAFVFLVFFFGFTDSIIRIVAYYGFLVNSWLGLFNLLPFAMFDGKKILNWNKFVYGILVFVAFVFMAMQGVVTLS